MSNIVKETYKVEGMTCASCANAAERAVRKLDGVVNQNVNLATEKLTVEFEDDKVDYDTLEKAISKAGYKLVKEEEKIESTKFLNKLRRLTNGLISVVDFVERRHEFVGKIRPAVTPEVSVFIGILFQKCCKIYVVVFHNKTSEFEFL